MIEFDFNFQLITILLFAAMVVCAIVVFPVYVRRIRRVASYAATHADDCEGMENAPQPDEDGLFTEGFSIVEDEETMKAAAAGPASIVVYAQDQAEALTRLLPRLLEQRYEPGFEVIVVNEGGSVATSDVVSMLASQHRNLYLTYTPDGARSLSRKKLALMLGIKAAQNRVVVHTMATATITSPLWLASIMRHFSDPSVEVVLGNAVPAYQENGMGSRRRTFDFYASDATWLTAAISGHSYRGTEYNIAYTRDLFFRNKGFSRSLDKRYGDDDIFVSEIATAENTVVELCPESRVEMTAHNTRQLLKELAMRHEFTGHEVSRSSRRMMATGEWMLWLMILCGIGAAVTALPNIIPAIAALVVIIAMLWVASAAWSRTIRALGGKRLRMSLPWIILMHPFRNMRLAWRVRRNRSKFYSWG